MTVPKICYWTIAVLLLFLAFTDFAVAATNISSYPSDHWAWNDVIGWIDFYGTDSVIVPQADGRIAGYANAPNIGYVALDCASAPQPPAPSCSGSAGNWGVEVDWNPAQTSGQLSGWAWSDVIGWISFCGKTQVPPGGDPTKASTWHSGLSKWQCPQTPDYGVTITVTSSIGEFSGWAWNDVVGWISFNCNNSGIGNTCVSVDYKVKVELSIQVLPSSWLISSVFDTCPDNANCGAAINAIMWKGCSPIDSQVRFQIASSDSDAGPWTFLGPGGLTTNFYGPVPPDTPQKIEANPHNNRRYFRYQVFLNYGTEASTCGIPSPIVRDIIVNWSP